MGRTLKLGLIGCGISRTQVHRLHQLLGGMAGIDVTYDLFDVTEPATFDLAAELSACEKRGYAGVNVTHPFKLQAYELTRPADEMPAGLRSVNTVVFDQGDWQGPNTDHTGFIRAFADTNQRVPIAGPVFLLGAGGVGTSLGFAVAELGASEIVVADTKIERAERLVGDLRSFGARARLANDDIEAEAKKVAGLINATPVGMHQFPGNPFSPAAIGRQQWAFDAVYTPVDTPFLQTAQAAGLTVISGFELFFNQGIQAFERFTGERLSPGDARRHFLNVYPQKGLERLIGQGAKSAS